MLFYHFIGVSRCLCHSSEQWVWLLACHGQSGCSHRTVVSTVQVLVLINTCTISNLYWYLLQVILYDVQYLQILYGLLLSVEDTGHVTMENRLTNLSFLLFSLFFCPFVLYCFISTVSCTPSRNHYLCTATICTSYTLY